MLNQGAFRCHLIRDEEGEAQVLQPLVEVGCHLLVLPPGLFQPLGGDRDQSTSVLHCTALHRDLEEDISAVLCPYVTWFDK